MTDQDLLAQLIARLQPRTDALAAAGRLLTVYGSLGPVLESEAQDLARAGGLGSACAQSLSLIPQLARYLAREQAQGMARVDSFAKAGFFLRGLDLGAKPECFHLLCLDGTGQVLSCALVQQGTVDEAPFYLRRILELSMRAGARAVVLSHNHPSGTPFFSPGDLACTQQAIGALLPLDVVVLDHILVADGKPYSLRGHPDFPEIRFTRQRPGDPLIAGWLREQEAEP